MLSAAKHAGKGWVGEVAALTYFPDNIQEVCYPCSTLPGMIVALYISVSRLR
jgi:hypothetical protein